MILTDAEVRALARRRGLCLTCAERRPVGDSDRCRPCGAPVRDFRRADEWLDDWRMIVRCQGEHLTVVELAARLGMTAVRVRRALARARARGDARALYPNQHAARSVPKLRRTA